MVLSVKRVLFSVQVVSNANEMQLITKISRLLHSHHLV